MGRLLPLHDEADEASLARWRPRFNLPDPQQVRLRRSAQPLETTATGVPGAARPA
jgi:hypothetical protein